MRTVCVLLVVASVFTGAWIAGAQEPAVPGRDAAPAVQPRIIRGGVIRGGVRAQPVNAVQPSGSDQLRMDSALVTLIEQVEVPARDVGQIEKFDVKEGEIVNEGDSIAQIEDKDAQLARNKAKIEADIAREASLNDTKLRSAQKSTEVAYSELRRAEESNEKHSSAVPAAELDRLKLTAEKSKIDVEQAEHELKAAKLTLDLKENEHALAEHNVARRKITAPLTGMVVQLHKHAGEWVQPGDKVVRIVRLNRLRVEAFLTRQEIEAQGDMVGRGVNLSVHIGGKPHDFAGKVVFVHPEINPLNGQMRVWAEVENRDLKLKPGMQGTLSVAPVNASVAAK